MGRPPAVVIVVRHGARLDAADKQWHLTSPTPYDPPLTYGGWTQSRALGARIASILKSRESGNDANGEATTDERKRRHKVIIHTSPFLRCVQTGIAISAGLAQNPGRSHHRSTSSSTTLHSSPKARPLVTDSPRLAPISEPGRSSAKSDGKPDNEDTRKATMRVDAFLGEWLSPDYFELITPPPSSIMMVAGAKADLLRREDTNRLINIRDMTTATSANSFVGFPGGWGSPSMKAIDDEKDDGPLSTMSSLAQVMPRRDRTSSLGSAGVLLSGSSTITRGLHSQLGIYNPPIPSYAISNADAIPPGYVSHARDACVDVDYQWDSMREPQNWGNGGEYGEEWSSMHKRFRRGLSHLIHWYRDQDNACKLIPRLPSTDDKEECDEEEDDDTDLVVILVTHGAGCNALIGALTNQPVLLDVGMASLTMAVYKPPKITPSSTPASTPKTHSRSGSRNLTLSDEYDVKLVANTEHLRSSSTSTPSSSRPPSMVGAATARSRFVDSSSPPPTQFRSLSSGNFGSMRRAASVASTSLSRTYVPARQMSIGLWTAPKPADEPEPEEPGDDMVLNFGDGGAESLPSQLETQNDLSPKSSAKENHEDDDDDDDDYVPELGVPGLWGRSKGMSDPIVVRENAPKRRWTINEHGAT